MRIAVVGAGAVGSLFGGLVSKAGYDVTLIDKYADRTVLLNEKGLRIQGVSGDHTVPIIASLNADDVGPVDVVLVCVKAYDTKNAIKQHIALVGENTTVVTMQNGFGNVDALSEVVGKEKVIGGTTAQGGFFYEHGHFHHAGDGPTHIGEPSGETTPRIEAIAKAFNDAGISTEISPDVDALIWTKLVVNVGINPLAALLNINNGYTSGLEGARAVQDAAVAEALKVSKAAGIKLDHAQVAKRVIEVAEVTFGNVNSMLSDVKNQKRTEIDYINGAIVNQGEKYGVPTPVNKTLTDLVKAVEQSYGKTVG